MSEQTIDHRRAVSNRNGAAILAATERLIEERKRLTMAAIATEAGVSRPTLYAHYSTLDSVVEAVIEGAVERAVEAIIGAKPDEGAPAEALTRMLAASWEELVGLDAYARAAAEYLPARYLHQAHAPFIAHLLKLAERGRKDGSFRDDLPAEWLVRSYIALVHAADEYARGAKLERAAVLQILTVSVRDLFAPR